MRVHALRPGLGPDRRLSGSIPRPLTPYVYHPDWTLIRVNPSAPDIEASAPPSALLGGRWPPRPGLSLFEVVSGPPLWRVWCSVAIRRKDAVSFVQRSVLILPDFGRIECFGSYWKGIVRLCAFGKPFELIVRARRDGPSAAQAAALARLVSCAASIRSAATAQMVGIHQDVPGFPDDDGTAGDRIWDLLEPAQIEVTDGSYYGDGRIAIMLMFESSLHPDFAPAIETSNGHFVQALGGT